MNITNKMLSLIVICLMFTACGFHLRGSQQGNGSQAFQQLAIDYQAQDIEFKGSLYQQLEQLDIVLTNSAPYRLTILSVTTNNQIASYDPQGKPQQYTLTLALVFSLTHSESGKRHGPLTLTRNQTYRFDSRQISSYTQEQRLLKNELQKTLLFELIQQLNRWIALDHTAPPLETTATSHN